MPNNNAFSIDYAEQLAKHILVINQRRCEELDKQAIAQDVPRGYLSLEMTRIYADWNNEIREACHSLLRAMNEQVNYATRLAADALNCSPVSFCSRADGHDGPCNGMPRRQCTGYPKGE